MRSDDLESIIINRFCEHFEDVVQDCVIKESTDVPFHQLTIEMTLYNYFVVRVAVEKNTLFFSIVQSGFQMELLKSPLTERELGVAIVQLDNEVRLRIPDKYLKAKGW